jgi:hypothetical protein
VYELPLPSFSRQSYGPGELVSLPFGANVVEPAPDNLHCAPSGQSHPADVVSAFDPKRPLQPGRLELAGLKRPLTWPACRPDP